MRRSEFLAIGAAPCKEACAQVGDDDYGPRALAEGRRFIEAIRRKLGPEPEGARLAIKGFPHDFGTYYEVVCWYDPDRETSAVYAYDCERDAPATWDEAEPLPETRCGACGARRRVDGGLCRRCVTAAAACPSTREGGR